jgi:flagellar motor switch protein FliN/FliY
LAEDLAVRSEVALAFANAAEAELGDDTILTVGAAQPSVTEILRDDIARAVRAHLLSSDESVGTIAVVLTAAFAETLERAASDEILITAAHGPLKAAALAIREAAGIDIEADESEEVDPAVVIDDSDDAIVYPILDGATPIACLVVVLGPLGDTNGATVDLASSGVGAVGLPGGFVLADVEMGVTAELGRCRMTVRELLSITPGAVIDLDRAAGAPVDVLVNGTLIARGEVVVIEEEFGIRISQLLTQPAQ